MNLIFVIALSALFVVLTVAEYSEMEINKICSKELDLSEDEISRINPDALRNPTGNLKCFGKCFLEKKEVVKDGVIQPIWYTRVNKDKENAQAFLDRCASIKAENDCEMARKFIICNYEFEDEIKKKKLQAN